MLASPFRIKICGITTGKDLVAAIESGADAIGLNFYSKSKRFVGRLKVDTQANEHDLRTIGLPEILFEQVNDESVGVTREFVRRAMIVGLFVNHPVEEVNEIAADWQLDWVQLHGDETPEFLTKIDPQLKIMRAYRTDSWDEVLADLEACRTSGRAPDALLIDANVAGSYGGTGATADWQAMADRQATDDLPPLILAGGLTPDNVAEAIRIVRPDGVDVASGVESSPGVKDREKMKQFVEAAKKAWEFV